MDLGLKGRRALVCAASQGLGFACASALAREGVAVTINGRDPARLEAARDRLQAATGMVVETCAADLNDAAARKPLIEVASGMDICRQQMVAPRQAISRTGRSRLARRHQLQHAAGPDAGPRGIAGHARAETWPHRQHHECHGEDADGSHGALDRRARRPDSRLQGAASRVAPDNVTHQQPAARALRHERQQQMARLAMGMKGITYEQARAEIEASIAARRMGRPEEFGDACAYLCSGPGRLHLRPEPATRRRLLPGPRLAECLD
jgi:3-oxoacyl-[acyl-carrier protein] reductase